MDLNLAFFAMVVYLGMYLFVIDRVAAEVDRVDPSYRKYANAPAAGYFSRSLFAATLLLDREMPKRHYVFGLKARLHLARAMLVTAPLLFLILLMI
ncbi:hypothetical protein CXF96_08710 [Stenotrophomonas sp. Betaine-02u-21]|uniref:hypothetical protein n=1 Tax=unclassified Stenotrophomonas TaxID=196198 RepID=UPI000C335C8A|nr:MULTISPECIES: hypothetical protein [unclassified Stenotrophomonas]PKH71431.1 hypothetical protein CXF90_10860 [Stenotrophomonas sp. Betaine-02u-23]PKH74380.1 hypothetical protein CXF96_08710 [Stenotrophomonas sp. Betaine-02u-21]PKH96589.1 hypothetical protein CXG43_06745 [Stenotrophomonas sp. Bg11-02]